MKPLIVVVGATGQQGGSVIKTLALQDKWTIRGLTRNIDSPESQALIQQGFDIVSADISSIDQCLKAFQDAYGVFAMTNFWTAGYEQEYEQGLNMVKAAQQQHVTHFIWSSLPNSDVISNGQINLPHYMSKARIESLIRQQENNKSFRYTTFVHIGFYYQNFLTFLQPNENFEFRAPLTAEARLPMFDVRDTGFVVAECFENPERWGNGCTIPIVAQQLTMNQICQVIRETTGNEKVSFVSLTPDQCSEKSQEYLNNMRWYNDYIDLDTRVPLKTREVFEHMKSLADWIKETGWLIDKA